MLKTQKIVTVLKLSKIKFPQKFKGTIIEKWADYWKNLFIDYRQMLIDLRSDIQDEPFKAMKWTAGLTTIWALAQHNPNETDFRNKLKEITNEVILVSEDCRKQTALEHLNFVQQCYNEQIIHYKSFGILSVIYTSNLNNSCDLYKAQCGYLKPSILKFSSRIVDFGIMGRWWNIFIKTQNYDVK